MADEKKKISSLDPSIAPKPEDKFVVSQGPKTYYETREKLRVDVKGYVMQSAGQPGGIVTLDDAGKLPAYVVPSNVLGSVALLSTVGNSFGSVVAVADSIRGGIFVYAADYPIGINDGTVFAAADGGLWVRLYNGPVDLKWFGAPVNGVDDDTPFCQAAIDSIGPGAYEFTSGSWRIDGLVVPSGVILFSNQNARDHAVSNVPAKISKHTTAATKIIALADNAQNVALMSLYVDGDYVNHPATICGAHLKGKSVTVFNCNFNSFAGPAIIYDCNDSTVDYNSIYGWYGAAPAFGSVSDFRGALQIEKTYGSRFTRNSIGAGLPCFQTYTNPLNMLRDQVAMRVAAVACRGLVASSLFTGNLFENGDRGFILGESQFNTFTNNRYVANGAGGLYIYGPCVSAALTGELFSGNSLSRNGSPAGPAGANVGNFDIEVAAGVSDKLSFVGCVFQKLTNALIPTAAYKVKAHVVNRGSGADIEVISGKFDLIYAQSVAISSTGAAAVRFGLSSTDAKNPVFETVTASKTSTVGAAMLTPGSIQDSMGFLRLDVPGNTGPVFTIGGSPKEYVSFYNYLAGSEFVFGNGNMSLQKTGDARFSLWSLDSTGNAELSLKGGSGPAGSSALVSLDTSTGDLHITSDADVVLGNGNFRLKGDGRTLLPDLSAGLILDVGLLGRHSVTGELVNVDPATVGQSAFVGNPGLDTAPTDEDLNTMYPYSVYKIGTRVVCRNISTGGVTYERDGVDSWVRYAHM